MERTKASLATSLLTTLHHSSLITEGAQLVVDEELHKELGDWHSDQINRMLELHKSMLYDVRADLQRVGGVVTQHGGGLSCTTSHERSQEATRIPEEFLMPQALSCRPLTQAQCMDS